MDDILLHDAKKLYKIVPTSEENSNNGYGSTLSPDKRKGPPQKRHDIVGRSSVAGLPEELDHGFGSESSISPKDWKAMSARYWRSWRDRTCTKKQLLRKFPILEWGPKYDKDKFICDLIAGITVGLTVIPQGIAYATVAELPPEYGLYSAFMGCFVYCIFGSSKDITVGPTAIMSLMTAEHAHGKGTDLVVLLCFLTGIIIAMLGILQLGFVIDFISVPVIAAFTSAAAITIAAGQVKSLFGLNITNGTDVPALTGDIIDVINYFDTIRYQDTIMGLSCIVILLLMRELKNVKWFDSLDGAENPSCMQRFFARYSNKTRAFLAKTTWLISTARNAIVVIICLIIAYGLDPDLPQTDQELRNTTFILTGWIDGGLPPFEPPPFNTTQDGVYLDFPAMVSELKEAIIIIPIIAILENMAIAKAFSGGKPIDANQEMIALGISNLMGSFVSSYPVTGSFSRTAVNAASGVKTTFGGIYTGTLVILALAFLMPACAYIPKATLAAVIITAVIFSVEYEVIVPLYKSKKIDLLVGIIAFLICLFWALEFGIVIGVALQVLVILYNTARPSVSVEIEELNGPGTEYIVVKMDRSLVFPSVNFVRNIINKAGLRHGQSVFPVVVDCQYIFTTDFTGAKGFISMAKDFNRRGQPIFFINLKKSVEDVFTGVGEDVLAIRSQQELMESLAEVFSNDLEEGGGGIVVDNAIISANPEHPLAIEEPQVVVQSPSDNDDSSSESSKSSKENRNEDA